MDRLQYEELMYNLKELEQAGELENKTIYLFGHCNETEELVNLLFEKGYHPAAILDNNEAKQGKEYKGIMIEPPDKILENNTERTIVCIAVRHYAAMSDQLKRFGYKGQIRKLVDYNSYADYSLSVDTVCRMKLRAERGKELLIRLNKDYPEYLKILCPFAALGDIYLMMSYLPHYLEQRNVKKCVIGIIGNACAEVVRLFGQYTVEIFSQKEMDETIQAALYVQDKMTFIPHQDRPYVVNLYKALYVKKIPLEQIYCCGVFGLPDGAIGYEPKCFTEYPDLQEIEAGKAVILSPYAKSVTVLPEKIWNQIIEDYNSQGYQCFTNVAGEQKALEGTKSISPMISEMKSVVERAGTFIGIRSGLCDVLRMAKAEKTALYPNYYYCDTKWKAIDMYSIDGWNNIEVKDDFVWKRN